MMCMVCDMTSLDLTTDQREALSVALLTDASAAALGGVIEHQTACELLGLAGTAHGAIVRLDRFGISATDPHRLAILELADRLTVLAELASPIARAIG